MEENEKLYDPVDWLVALSRFLVLLTELDIYGFNGRDIWGGYRVHRIADHFYPSYPLSVPMPELLLGKDIPAESFVKEVDIELIERRYDGHTFSWSINLGQSRQLRTVVYNRASAGIRKVTF